MSKNIKQIFDANPASSMQNTDLLYLGRSPYGASDNFAITYANLLSSIAPASITNTQGAVYNFGVDSGVADAYEVALTPTLTSYKPGMIVAFYPLNSSATTSPTVEVDGLGAFSVVDSDLQSVQVGAFQVGNLAYLICDTTTSSFIMLNAFVSSPITIGAIQGNLYNFGNDSGVADAYVVTNTFSPASFTRNIGSFLAFDPANTNTSATPTVDFNGNGPTTILNIGEVPLIAGQLSSGQTALMIYTELGYVLLNPAISLFSTITGVQESSYNVASDSGVADAYAIALNPAITSYANGTEVAFIPANNSTITTPTLAVNGLAAKTIVLSNGALQAGDMTTAMIAKLIYNSAADNFVLLTPVVS